MAKPRATTIQQRFGFKDNDLKTPLHDEILLWLDENIESVLNHLLSTKRLRGYQKAKEEGCPEELLQTKCSIKVIDKLWEVPIMSHRYCIGFVDFVAVFSITAVHNFEYYSHRPPRWEIAPSEGSLYFEIKTTIPSLGELVRQIRLYEEYANYRYVVVCPDDRFQKPLLSQKIWFLKYDTTFQPNLFS